MGIPGIPGNFREPSRKTDGKYSVTGVLDQDVLEEEAAQTQYDHVNHCLIASSTNQGNITELFKGSAPNLKLVPGEVD